MKALAGDTEKSHRATAVPRGSQSRFLSSITKSKAILSSKADVPACSFFFGLTEDTLARRGLTKRSLSLLGALNGPVNIRNWKLKCNQNINKGPWWKKGMAWYVPSHHMFWRLVNGIPSRKCQAHRSSWRSSQEKASVLEQGCTYLCGLLKGKAHRGPPHVLRKHHNAHLPSSHTHGGTNQPFSRGQPPTHTRGCSARLGLFRSIRSFLYL